MSSLSMARQRFYEIMRRHVHLEDLQLDDDLLVRTVVNRYLHDRGLPLIDPSE